MAVILNSQQEVLIAKRPLKKSYGGLWEFPGGKLERGETPQEAVKRELIEELGISIKIVTSFKSFEHEVDSGKLLRFHPLLCQYFSGNIVLTEHADARWVNRKKLMDFNFAAPDYPVIELLQQYFDGTIIRD
jgi:8-oxo-dGTP diphosphatase